MTHSTKMKAAVAGVLAFGLSALAAPAPKPNWKGHEKCAGVATAGMNDCGTSSHECAGMGKTDKSPDEWMYLPTGTCTKISGGHLVTKAMMEKEKK